VNTDSQGQPSNSDILVQYREDVRSFIRQLAPRNDVQDGVRAPETEDDERRLREWYHQLFSAGYLGGGWPVEWGGRPGHRTAHDTIVMEELIRARAPRPLDQTLLAAHVLIAFGTEAQKQSYLPRIRSGTDVWCQLFSEPGVGSDLAALTTRATALADGSGFRVDGQKVWTTDAQWAQMGVLLARTDPTASLHSGITAFVVPMDAAGVDIRPIREMTGLEEFSEVFLDSVFLSHDHVLGQVDRGWEVVSSGLASERGYIGANAVQLDVMHQDLVALARVSLLDGTPAIEQGDVRLQLASLKAAVEAARTSSLRATSDDPLLVTDGSEGLVAKLTYTELYVQLSEAAVALIGITERMDNRTDELRERWFHAMLWSRALTISGGASEIIRSLIAQQALGLPRSWARANKG
jgi:alkylation response protein AidB-like acyl-CoA dehydrogenase